MPQISFKRILILFFPCLIVLSILLSTIILISPLGLIYFLIKLFLDFINNIHKRNKFIKLQNLKKDVQ